MKDSILKIRNSSIKYRLNSEYNLSENLFEYIKKRIEANKEEIIKLIDLKKEKINNITIKGSMSDFKRKYKIEQKAKQRARKAKYEKSVEREPILSLGEAPSYSSKDWSRDKAKSDIYKYIGKKVIAYTDGSYNNKTEKSGYGIIYFARNNQDREPIALSGELCSLEMHQIVGEIKAVEVAIRRAIDEKRSHIEIRYDYEGVEKWATGEWKANKKRTQEYKGRIKDYSKHIQICFSKVDAHTGDIFNEEADRVAKKACGML